MHWDALTTQSVWIQVHVAAALFALLAGAAQFALIGLGQYVPAVAQGSQLHRGLGYVWAVAMLTVAGTSFMIHELRQLGPWSLIHLLSVMVLFTVPAAVLAARRGSIKLHRASMRQIYFFALIVTGAFTLLPGRVMHTVVFGP